MKTSARRRPQRNAPTGCPCTSGKAYRDCCEPLHTGDRKPQLAIELVRARFSAFALGLGDYLWRTLHSAHDDRAGERDGFVARAQRSMGQVKYRRLEILDVAEIDSHGIARVLFAADVQKHKLDLSFVEQAEFALEQDDLRYIVGVARSRKELSHDISDMRLDHWQCEHHHG